jgi:hypothetical protein
MWLQHKLHLVHPPGSGHTLYTVEVRNLNKSLANFVSCFLAEICRYRPESTLRAMWLDHKMHFIHPSGCGHGTFTVGVKNHYNSLANFVSCDLA